MNHPIIVGVAIKCGDLIISMPKPARHSDIINNPVFFGAKLSDEMQGFITSEGEFLPRGAARILVIRNSQPTKSLGHPSELFSEDLW